MGLLYWYTNFQKQPYKDSEGNLFTSSPALYSRWRFSDLLSPPNAIYKQYIASKSLLIVDLLSKDKEITNSQGRVMKSAAVMKIWYPFALHITYFHHQLDNFTAMNAQNSHSCNFPKEQSGKDLIFFQPINQKKTFQYTFLFTWIISYSIQSKPLASLMKVGGLVPVEIEGTKWKRYDK